MAVRLLVCGGRDYADREHLFATLDDWLTRSPGMVLGVGYNPADKRFQGADQLAYEWAVSRGVKGACYPAHWKALGRAAGPRRNRRMFETFKPTAVQAFPGGRGTADMCGVASEAGVPVTASAPR